MSDVVRCQKNVASLEKENSFNGYSLVVINVSDDLSYTAGTDSGRTLTLECPWGTQEMANNILASIRGYQYQPYSATEAYIDPAAELGDALSVGNVYGAICKKMCLTGDCIPLTCPLPEAKK